MATLQKGWAGAGHSGEHSVIVYLRVFSTWCLFVVVVVVLNSAASSLHPQLPSVSTQSDITRHWCLLMFHILPSGPSKVVKKNSKTREAMRRHTGKNKTKQKRSAGNAGPPGQRSGLQLAPGPWPKVGLYYLCWRFWSFHRSNSGGIRICKRTQGYGDRRRGLHAEVSLTRKRATKRLPLNTRAALEDRRKTRQPAPPVLTDGMELWNILKTLIWSFTKGKKKKPNKCKSVTTFKSGSDCSETFKALLEMQRSEFSTLRGPRAKSWRGN